MATTGTKSAKSAKMDATVTIKNGAPLPGQETVNIPTQGTVEFKNADKVDYTLQFSDYMADRHSPLCVLLPAGGTMTVVGGSRPNDKNATCDYYVNGTTSPGKAGVKPPLTGGGNKIIIGSGNVAAK